MVGTIEPTTMRLLKRTVEVRETWIEIYHLPEMELVTAIEILSPSNKGGSGRTDYLAKRDALIDQPVNLVEVDLLLSGSRMPVSGKLKPGEYVAIVARANVARRPMSMPGRCGSRCRSCRSRSGARPRRLARPGRGVPDDLRPRRVRPGDAYGRPLPEGLPISPEDRTWAEGLAK